MKANTNRFENTIFIGMDVHKKSFTLCCYTVADDKCWGQTKMDADYNLVPQYIQKAREYYDLDARVVCGYEAGTLGYSLQRFLAPKGITCIILAPSTMETSAKARKLKTDKRDAAIIARCLAMNSYKPVFVPSEKDEEIKRFIRMREDLLKCAKSIKQQINAFCLSHGYKYTEGKNHWTQMHMNWLKKLQFSEIDQETLETYLLSLQQLDETLKRVTKRIEEFAQEDAYRENVQKLCCFNGVSTYTALAIIVETGDFARFAAADKYSGFLGLVPGEDSSSENVNHLGITKAGNVHLRRLLTESAQHYQRGKAGQKSAALKKRQAVCSPKYVAYADRCNERLHRKFYKMKNRNKNSNIAKIAVARELACFIWGMMTGNHDRKPSQPDVLPNAPESPHLRFQGKPFSLGTKKKVSPEPPSKKKGGVGGRK